MKKKFSSNYEPWVTWNNNRERDLTMGKPLCNGVPLAYRQVGKGRHVVLIHGLAANQAFWHLNVLLPLARDYKVTVYDLRGHGRSGMPPQGYSSRDMASDLHGLLDHLHIPQANIVGHSFGGVVALHFAHLYPEWVQSLTIVDSRVRALQPTQSPKDWPNRERALKRLRELGLDIPEDEPDAGLWLLERLASPELRQTRQKLEGSPRFVPFGGWNGGQRTAERWLELMRNTTAKQDFTSMAGLTLDKLAAIPHPTLAIYGEHSAVMPSCRGLLNHLAQCQTAIVPGGGHFFPLTHQTLFVDLVSQFLEEVARQDRRQHGRVQRRLPVEFQDPSNCSYQGLTVNVSRQGLLVDSPQELRVGVEVNIVVTPQPFGPKISLRGMVVRGNGQENGHDRRFGIRLYPEGRDFTSWQEFLAA
jgi:pimeloyl-ACP methyl ester carboxylesterase